MKNLNIIRVSNRQGKTIARKVGLGLAIKERGRTANARPLCPFLSVGIKHKVNTGTVSAKIRFIFIIANFLTGFICRIEVVWKIRLYPLEFCLLLEIDGIH